MTDAQLDHLKRIDAHLERLLDIASKRTPGEWEFTFEGGNGGASFPRIIEPGDFAASAAEVSIDDAFFIAACAGNAEAGWRATRAAIACLLVICDPASGADYTNYGDEVFLHEILAAFPFETLK